KSDHVFLLTAQLRTIFALSIPRIALLKSVTSCGCSRVDLKWVDFPIHQGLTPADLTVALHNPHPRFKLPTTCLSQTGPWLPFSRPETAYRISSTRLEIPSFSYIRNKWFLMVC